jgi:glutamate racemase
MTPTIGVFDSGFGGLTVLRALLTRLPNANYAFLGDTARLPYGSKSRRTIARYAAESAQFLVQKQGAQFLVVACNTASALALDAIQAAVPVPVLGVIEPGAAAARGASRTGDVLVVATDATVQSHAYATACRAQGMRAIEKACPLLVPLVEEGWTGHPVTAEVIRIYLAELLAEAAELDMRPDTLVLGCTHYPLLRPLLEAAVPPGMKVIDSAEATAEAAARLFGQKSASRSPSLDGRDESEDLDLVTAEMQIVEDSFPQELMPAILPAAPGTAQFAPGDQADAARGVLTQGDISFGDPAQIRCFATDSVEKFERLGSRFLGRDTGPVALVDLGG